MKDRENFISYVKEELIKGLFEKPQKDIIVPEKVEKPDKDMLASRLYYAIDELKRLTDIKWTVENEFKDHKDYNAIKAGLEIKYRKLAKEICDTASKLKSLNKALDDEIEEINKSCEEVKNELRKSGYEIDDNDEQVNNLIKAHIGFKKLVRKLKGKKGVEDAKAIAASIAFKKYGKRKVAAYAKKGKSMAHAKPLKKEEKMDKMDLKSELKDVGGIIKQTAKNPVQAVKDTAASIGKGVAVAPKTIKKYGIKGGLRFASDIADRAFDQSKTGKGAKK